jgi:hypothetical protein
VNSLFLQGLTFSTVVIGVLAFLTWWLFLSPLRVSVGGSGSPAPQSNKAVATSARLSHILALLIGIGALLICFGGYWDASEHEVTGIIPGGEDFLWPPHLMLYAGFMFAFIVAVGGLVAVAIPNLKLGIRDPRNWVRRNPYVGAVVLIAGYGLFSIPGDAIWHELYGVDLTAWSPPHFFLAMSASSLVVFAAGLFLSGSKRGKMETDSFGPSAQSSRSAAGASRGRHTKSRRSNELDSRADWRSFANLFYFAIALLLFVSIGTIEWEMETVSKLVARRPIWLYPTIIGVSSFFFLIVGRRLASGPWTATVMALFYFGLRIAVTAFAEVVSGAPPRLTLVFILGAVLLDLTWQWMPRFGFKAGGWQQSLASAGAFMVGYTLVSQPTIAFYLLQFLPSFAVPDHLLTALFTFMLCAALYPVALALGGWLKNAANKEIEVRQGMPDALSNPANG